MYPIAFRGVLGVQRLTAAGLCILAITGSIGQE